MVGKGGSDFGNTHFKYTHQKSADQGPINRPAGLTPNPHNKNAFP